MIHRILHQGALSLLGFLALQTSAEAALAPIRAWETGAPVVTYWCGPSMTDAAATQLAEGGWNLVWCGEGDLDVAHRHGLRGQLTDALLSPDALEDPVRRAKLDALVDRVKRHPAMYAYFLTDEPGAAAFPAWGRLVRYLRERDPAHLAYINLFPTYANNEQLGTDGDKVTAYRKHLRQFVDVVKPSLISYDHYQFSVKGDNPDYFLNLAMIRQAALEAGVPFLNIVQACTWTPSMRVPVADEMRYLIYTSLAYGAQGISYYVYSCPNHTGGIALPDGTPTPLYHALRGLNREFAAIAGQLQPMRSLGVYHAGMNVPGGVGVPAGSGFRFEPTVTPMNYAPPERVRGMALGLFGRPRVGGGEPRASHAVVVNLDYRNGASVGLRGPGRLEEFEPGTGRWVKLQGNPAKLDFGPGAGVLVRIHGAR